MKVVDELEKVGAGVGDAKGPNVGEVAMQGRRVEDGWALVLATGRARSRCGSVRESVVSF